MYTVMNYFKSSFLLLLSFLLLSSCFDDNDDILSPSSNIEIGDFVWKGLNTFYLYKDDVLDLADSRFETQGDLNNYISDFSSPETLFENLIYDRPLTDKFSWIVDDYVALENSFAGVSKKNGMSFGFFVNPEENGVKAYGIVRYVLPNTSASNNGIVRGDIFSSVNGIQITYDNTSGRINNGIISSLNEDSYTIGLANYDGSSVISTGEDISLNKRVLTENPILISKTLDVNSKKIGYLLYNSFTADFDDALNNVFADFKSEGVTDLVLDFRYNPGGSVYSAITLSSLVTGQFTGDIFSTEQWNTQVQDVFEQNNPERIENRFISETRNGQSLNSLNLNKVYILTTGRSASASELVINGLNPYIDVIQIGTATTGKFQASITLYDSDDFSKNNVNPNHNYAMQPLVLKSLNSVGFTDYFDGFSPNAAFELSEDFSNLGVLGAKNEPLLSLALFDITGADRFNFTLKPLKVKSYKSIDFLTSPHENTMYIDK
jgi:carboxyl-terminal processing protease